MPKFRKKAVEIFAEQYLGLQIAGVCTCPAESGNPHLHTMHDGQTVVLQAGDWIIPDGMPATFYPCKPDVFTATYDPVRSEPREAFEDLPSIAPASAQSVNDFYQK